MTRRIRFHVPWAARCAAAAAVGLTAANGASAFFFKGWPGDRIARPPTLLPPGTSEQTPRTVVEFPPPTESPPGDTTPPGGGPPGGGPPGTTPEPATGLLAAVGVGLVALARRRFRRRSG